MTTNEIQRSLGNLEAKVDILLSRTAKTEESNDKELCDLNNRVTVLETNAQTQKAVITLIASAAGIVVTFAADFIKTKLFG
jgi:hypothetical protein